MDFAKKGPHPRLHLLATNWAARRIRVTQQLCQPTCTIQWSVDPDTPLRGSTAYLSTLPPPRHLMHTSHLGILLECRLWGLRLTSNKPQTNPCQLMLLLVKGPCLEQQSTQCSPHNCVLLALISPGMDSSRNGTFAGNSPGI